MSITCSQVKAFTTEHSAGGGVRVTVSQVEPWKKSGEKTS